MIPERPSGRRAPDGFRERLTGCALIVGGLLAFGAVVLLWLLAPATMPVPPSLPTNLLPLLSPINCILPLSGAGASALVVIGIRKLLLGS